jgi:8-oxo-dGTP pyrophosphatase MutT (NUDIX family)
MASPDGASGPSPFGEPADPIPAATLVLARAHSDGPQVLLVRRAATLRFMPNLAVFPGGRLDADDRTAFDQRALPASTRLSELPTALHPLVWTAWRECNEEVNIDVQGGGFGEVATWSERLTPFARWVTPPLERRRYDTVFFLLEVPPDTEGRADEQETHDAAWWRPADAIAAALEGSLLLAPPTFHVLHNLARRPALDDWRRWTAAHPLAPVHPALVSTDPVALAFPGDPEHTADWALDAPHRLYLRAGSWFETAE